jgi:hypothetical protein
LTGGWGLRLQGLADERPQEEVALLSRPAAQSSSLMTVILMIAVFTIAVLMIAVSTPDGKAATALDCDQ